MQKRLSNPNSSVQHSIPARSALFQCEALPSSTKCSLSVVVLNYNGKHFLKDCLGSIRENTHDITYEVILVDNASTDGSVEYVKKEFPWVRVIENRENVGFSKGNNIGVKNARGKYVCILNNDTIILPDALNNLVHFMEDCTTAFQHKVLNSSAKHSLPAQSAPFQHEVLATPPILATGKVSNFDGTPQVNCGKFPTLLSEYLRFAFFQIKYIDNPYSRKFRIRTYVKDEIQEADWVSGCYFIIEREEFLKLGGFDERFQAFYEDSDLCLRFHKAGGKVLYYPFSVIEHLKSGYWQTQKLKAVSIDYQSAYYFFKKHYGLFLSKIFNYLTKGAWIFDIIILATAYLITLGKRVKIKNKIKLLVNLFQTKVRL